MFTLPVRRSIAVVTASVAALGLALTSAGPAASEQNEGNANASAQSRIAAGGFHACAVLPGPQIGGATVECWGSNSAGQLGVGPGVDHSSTPLPVQGIGGYGHSGALSITAGSFHTCAILENNTAWCWGLGSGGRLGNGSTADSNIPVQVTGLGSGYISAITAGGAHTCAIVSQTYQGPGQVKCWGRNLEGLGDGSTTTSAVPVTVAGVTDAFAVSAGGAHTCAIVVDQTVHCWGDNFQGNLGIPGPASPVPVTVAGVTEAVAISAGAAHTCVIGSGGAATCWGWNPSGQLGNGSVDTPLGPTAVSGGHSFTAISAGYNSTCGVSADGKAWCWGDGGAGQLGAGDLESSTSPRVVPSSDSAYAVTVDNNLACALYIPHSSDLRCWGANGFGQVGKPNEDDGLEPSPITVLSAPAAPTNVTVHPGDGSATVSFTPGATGGVDTSYEVETEPWVTPVAGASSPITVEGLTNGESYRFRVVARNALGRRTSGWSPWISPSAQPFYEVSDVTVTEGNVSTTDANFTITRFGNTTGSSSVRFATDRYGDFPAEAPGDYAAEAFTVQFSANQTSRLVRVSVKGDFVAETVEQFALELSAPSRGQIWDDIGVGTILDDDSDSPPSFGVADVSVVEGDSGTKNATFTVTRYGSLASTASVKYRTVNGSATSTSDYGAKALTTLSFAAGVPSKTVTVSVKGDLIAESNEFFRLELSAPRGATLMDASADGIIVNDDESGPPRYSVSDAFITEGDIAKTLRFTITRTGNLAASTKVRYQTVNGTATSPADYAGKALTWVTFYPGDKTKTASITIKGDNIAELAETFFLILSEPSAGSSILDGTGRATIINDD